MRKNQAIVVAKLEPPPEVMHALFKRLPKSTRAKLNFQTDLKGITGAVLIVSAIHDAYSTCAHVLTELRRKKRAHGYCGGEVSCMAFVGEAETVKLCSTCRRIYKERRENPDKKPRRLTEYAQLRKRMRETVS